MGASLKTAPTQVWLNMSFSHSSLSPSCDFCLPNVSTSSVEEEEEEEERIFAVRLIFQRRDHKGGCFEARSLNARTFQTGEKETFWSPSQWPPKLTEGNVEMLC